jgi:hypothetical protein
MQDTVLESGIALGLDTQKIGGMFQSDLMPVMTADDLPGETVADVRP